MLEQLIKKSINLIEKSSSILIIPPQAINNESIGSSFGLALFLENLGKKTEILISSDLTDALNIPDNLSIKKPSSIIPDIFDNRAFVIKIDTKTKPANELRYEAEKDFLKIIIDSHKENFSPEDVSFEYTPFDHDLIICLGINNIKELGDIYERNRSFFETTAIININNKPIKHFAGQESTISLINQSSGSKSEIVFSLLKKIHTEAIDKDIANWLALSLIESTDNFQKSGLPESSFNAFSELIKCGAQKEKLTKLTKSREDDELFDIASKIMTSGGITKIKNDIFIKIPRDLLKIQINKQSLSNLSRELFLTFFKTENLFLIIERDSEFILTVFMKNKENLDKINEKIHGSLYENCLFSKIKAENINEAQDKIITLLNVSW